MEIEKVSNISSAIKAVIKDSKISREKRGNDFFHNVKESTVRSEKTKDESSEYNWKLKENYKEIKNTYRVLNSLLENFDREIALKNEEKIPQKTKTRSKSIHVYVDSKLEEFLEHEHKNQEKKWNLRKNAGYGSLIQKILLRFSILEKREKRQIAKIQKIISEFRECIVGFKKYSQLPDEYGKAELYNKKLCSLSSDLEILLSILEIDAETLKANLSDNENFSWIKLILNWKNKNVTG